MVSREAFNCNHDCIAPIEAIANREIDKIVIERIDRMTREDFGPYRECSSDRSDCNCNHFDRLKIKGIKRRGTVDVTEKVLERQRMNEGKLKGEGM